MPLCNLGCGKSDLVEYGEAVTRAMNSTRLKFELIEPQTPDRSMASPLAQLSARLRREEQPQVRQPDRPRLVQDLAQGLEFLMAQLGQAERDRDNAKADAERMQVQSSKMRGEIADLQQEFKAAGDLAAELRETRRTLEVVIAEQQKALLLSMELMQRFEGEIAGLRNRLDAVESSTAAIPAIPDETFREMKALRAAQADADTQLTASLVKTGEAAAEAARLREQLPALEARIAELDAKLADASAKGGEFAADAAHLREQLATIESRNAEFATRTADLKMQLEASLEESSTLRRELAERSKLGDPTIIRSLEEQRDIARADSASARADVSIQSAEIETKDALINALERALEQQHGSLRSLETRFAEYANRLQEIRMDRLRMPETGSVPKQPPLLKVSGMKRLVDGVKQAFSPPVKPEIEPTEEPGP